LGDLKEIIIRHGATGATMTNLSRGKFADLKVVDPGQALVMRFHNLTSPIFDQCLNMQQRNLKLATARDLLLPKLISGELDVSELDIKVPEEAA
jgi:type I restriction enzyme S subunit